MKTFESIADFKSYRKSDALLQKTVGFVPTMGALHDGHVSLIKSAKQENDICIASVFINPTQFNNNEDFEKYPRNVERDLEILSAHNVDAVLLPLAAEIYKDNFNYKLSENKISHILCGAHRPGHFDGVLTIVAKLFNIVRADTAYFGEKDYQQLKLVQEMANNFFFDTQVKGCPIVREESGLAMSSRNERLSQSGRATAALINKFLRESSSAEEARTALEKMNFRVEYVEEHWGRRLAAAWFENVRLIDNVEI